MAADAMTVADVLRAAADELLVNGWIQHRAGDDDGPKCMVGAVCFVGAGSVHATMNHTVGDAVDDMLRAVIGEYALGRWNDTYGRTVDDVVSALLRAADEFEARHAG